MEAFRLGPGDEGERIIYTHYTDGSKRRIVRTKFPSANHSNDVWRLHARVPPGLVKLFIHEANGPIAPPRGPLIVIRTFELRRLYTRTKQDHEKQNDAGEVHAWVPKATEDRIYEIYLYRHEQDHMWGDRFYLLDNGEAAPRNAIIPPVRSGAKVTYFDGALMSRMEFEQGLAWSPVWRWMQNIPNCAVPPQEQLTSAAIERQFADSPQANLVKVNEGSSRARLLQANDPWLDIDVEEV